MTKEHAQAEATFLKKENWGPGPWHEEPDHLVFEHAGHPCILHRADATGAWCGYVAVPAGHPWHGLDYGEFEVEVHGGLTYANKCQGDICHVPPPGSPDGWWDAWWFGFDASHCFDRSPAREACFRIIGAPIPAFGDEYRTMEYMREQTKGLAEQAAAAAVTGSEP